MCPDAPNALVIGGIGIVGAVIGNVTGQFISYRLAHKRDYIAECGRITGAFYELLAYLEDGAYNIKMIEPTESAHTAAIGAFQTWLPVDRQQDFRSAARNYRKVRAQAKLAEQVNSLKSEQALALKKAIESLLAFVEEPEGCSLNPF